MVANREVKHWGIANVLNALIIFLIFQVAFVFIASGLSGGGNGIDVIKQSPWTLFLVSLVMYAPVMGYMVFNAYKNGGGRFAKEYGLSFKLSDFLWGVVVGLALFGLCMAILSLVGGLLGTYGIKSLSDRNELANGDLGALLVYIGLTGFLKPVCEELFFRGFIQKGIVNSYRNVTKNPPFYMKAPILSMRIEQFLLLTYKYAPLTITSLLFGFMHFQSTSPAGWLIVVLISGVGLVLGIMAEKTKRLGMGIVTHIVFNLSVLLIPTLM